MKKTYIKPEMEIDSFENEDVITASGELEEVSEYEE